MIPLYDLLQLKYSTINFNDFSQIQIGDRGLGAGPEIIVWNVQNIPQPTTDDIAEMRKNIDIRKQYQAQLNNEINQPIIMQLKELDLKAIRPLLETDTTKLAEIINQKTILRAALLSTDTATIVLSDNVKSEL